MNKFFETDRKLNKISQQTDSIIIAFSGGKESRICLHLCKKHFKNIFCYYMYNIPNLRSENEKLEYVKEFCLKELIQIPHPAFLKELKNANLNWCNYKLDNSKTYELKHIYEYVKCFFSCQYIITGAKNADGTARRKTISRQKNSNIITPLINWNKHDVYLYIKQNHIPIPENFNKKLVSFGCDIYDPLYLQFLSEKYPDDLEKIELYFPFVRAVLKRFEYYGK
jgi:3'-phosphoadenosine 5'-phosphosulfate sulfotransferase (PAPS reductase)/FAD synthetase